MKRIKMPPLCQCGCGGFVKWNVKKGCWNRFVWGHNSKGKNHYFYGLCHTKGKREAISSKMSGELNPMYGRKRPDVAGDNNPMRRPEVLAKVSGCNNPRFGKGHLYSGDKNPNWRGGISCDPYCPDWTKEYKEYIKERDSNTCQNPDCWGTIKKLAVHHIDYNKNNCIPKNLLTLCGSCNSRANFDREFWMQLYQGIIEEKYKQKMAA